MEDDDRVLARLERIDALTGTAGRRGGAAPVERPVELPGLLGELRGLLREAEAAARAQARPSGEEVVGRRRAAQRGT
jgi:hypothetical protein